MEGEAGEERESGQVQVTCKAGLCVGRPFHSCGAGSQRMGGFSSLFSRNEPAATEAAPSHSHLSAAHGHPLPLVSHAVQAQHTGLFT